MLTQIIGSGLIGGGGGGGGTIVDFPVGGIIVYSKAATPTGYLLCNGAAVSRTTNAALFSVIGTTFGVGDGSTTFNLPSFVSRMPMGSGTLSFASSGGSFSHSHIVSPLSSGSTSNNSGSSGDVDTFAPAINAPVAPHTHPFTVEPGASGAANPPYMALRFYIKV